MPESDALSLYAYDQLEGMNAWLFQEPALTDDAFRARIARRVGRAMTPAQRDEADRMIAACRRQLAFLEQIKGKPGETITVTLTVWEAQELHMAGAHAASDIFDDETPRANTLYSGNRKLAAALKTLGYEAAC